MLTSERPLGAWRVHVHADQAADEYAMETSDTLYESSGLQGGRMVGT
jgi:hypothetical protein